MAENLADTNVGNIEYIRKADAVKALGEEYIPRTDFERGMISQLSCNKAKIKALPPADVAPVERSRWIKTADGAGCENCGREAVYQIVDDHWEYEPWCPHCGARMDGKEEQS